VTFDIDFGDINEKEFDKMKKEEADYQAQLKK